MAGEGTGGSRAAPPSPAGPSPARTPILGRGCGAAGGPGAGIAQVPATPLSGGSDSESADSEPGGLSHSLLSQLSSLVNGFLSAPKELSASLQPAIRTLKTRLRVFLVSFSSDKLITGGAFNFFFFGGISWCLYKDGVHLLLLICLYFGGG